MQFIGQEYKGQILSVYPVLRNAPIGKFYAKYMTTQVKMNPYHRKNTIEKTEVQELTISRLPLTILVLGSG